MKPSSFLRLISCLAINLVDAQSSTPNTPRATVQNGTYEGRFLPEYNQDLFLGIPYAQAPLGQLRLARPQPLNQTWTGPRSVTDYFPECVGYGGDQLGYPVSEDCLALNIVRPTGMNTSGLPVGVWIHGGGYVMGGASDLRYNLSFIVQNSVKMGKPIIGVSIAYRLSGWGFLDGRQIREAGATNLGIRDQRLALRWIQENIGAFGGDRSKVTIWGESAGAGSVGIHLTAYNGRNDSLFNSAIMESGAPILLGPKYNATNAQAVFDNITAAVNCSSASNPLSCLRSVNYTVLNNALNISTAYSFFPYEDGSLINGSQYQQLLDGQFIRVPVLQGANTDEGTAFASGGIPINNDSDFRRLMIGLTGGANNVSTYAGFELVYPNIPALGIPQTYNTTPSAAFGVQFKRGAAFAGDFYMIAPRRFTCQQWAAYNTSTYCYRFNWPISIAYGATHFQEVAFVFNNLQGLGYRGMNPFAGAPPSVIQLSNLMSSMWVSFIHDGNPNNHGQVQNPPVSAWPVYNNGVGGYGQEFVFDSNVTSYPGPDTYRGAAIAYMNTLWKSQFGK